MHVITVSHGDVYADPFKAKASNFLKRARQPPERAPFCVYIMIVLQV